jgi:alpha-tubulin suppressor-like RCC1 family protein
MAQSQLRGNKQIQSGSITNTEIASDANIALSKIQSGSVLSELNGRISNLETNAFVTREIPSGLINGSNRVYTLANPIVTGSEQVFLNGLLQDPGASDTYTIVGTTITFNTAPLTGDEIHVSYASADYMVAPAGAGSGGGGGSAGSLDYGTIFSGERAFDGTDEGSAVIRSDGALFTVGNNQEGQLGQGDTTNRYSLRRVGSETNWTKIHANKSRRASAAFRDFYIAIKSNGTLWAWGRNDYGQLGVGDASNRYSPVQVGSDTWSMISLGDAHALGIKSNGTLWSWGANGGRLGLGDDGHRYSPVQIGSDSNWSKVGAGSTHGLAIKTNGTLWAWGDNSYNKLGNGTGVSTKSPIQIGSDTNWVEVYGGVYHSVARKSNGTLWAWGYGGHGNLGQGNTTDISTPTQIGSDTDWSKLFLTEYTTFAIKTNGKLWGWGYNDSYMLGDGTTTQRNAPVLISDDTDWSEVRGGRFHTLASKTDGTLYAWGANNYGELCEGTISARYGLSKSEIDLKS